MKRTGEYILSTIGHIFNVLSILLMGAIAVALQTFFADETNRQAMIEEIQRELENDPETAGTTATELTEILDASFNFMQPVLWGLVALVVISLILAIIGTVKLSPKKNKHKSAGIFFILAGLFAGGLSVVSILYYIVAIMCFVRKNNTQLPVVQEASALQLEKENYYYDAEEEVEKRTRSNR